MANLVSMRDEWDSKNAVYVAEALDLSALKFCVGGC
jgi:hypothetical protein